MGGSLSAIQTHGKGIGVGDLVLVSPAKHWGANLARQSEWQGTVVELIPASMSDPPAYRVQCGYDGGDAPMHRRDGQLCTIYEHYISLIERASDREARKPRTVLTAHAAFDGATFTIALTSMSGEEVCAFDLDQSQTERDIFEAAAREIKELGASGNYAKFDIMLESGEKLATDGNNSLGQLLGEPVQGSVSSEKLI